MVSLRLEAIVHNVYLVLFAAAVILLGLAGVNPGMTKKCQHNLAYFGLLCFVLVAAIMFARR